MSPHSPVSPWKPHHNHRFSSLAGRQTPIDSEEKGSLSSRNPDQAMRFAAHQHVVSWIMATLLLFVPPATQASACCCLSMTPHSVASPTKKADGCCPSAGKSRSDRRGCGRCGANPGGARAEHDCPCADRCSDHDPAGTADRLAMPSKKPCISYLLSSYSDSRRPAESDNLGHGVSQRSRGCLPLTSSVRCALLGRFLL